jgi:signal transduction histidine kinase
MAEFATGILHNIGNVLNSVSVAASCMADNLSRSESANLSKVTAMLKEHEAVLGDFLTNDPKGRQVPLYLDHLAGQLASEQAAALKDLAQLRKNIGHIRDILNTQQGLAKIRVARESVNVTEMLDDALRMNASEASMHGILVSREGHDLTPITVERSLVLQILLNLIRNAQQSCAASGCREKKISLLTSAVNGGVRIAVRDNGVGIPPENLALLFTHGFTTKENGHGFGLHSAALAAKEMGGLLTVHSDGPGHGAMFILELPCTTNILAHEKSAP